MEIEDFNIWWKTGEIEEDYSRMKRRADFDEVVKFVDARQILVISGLRRTGKTVLMHHLIQHLLKKGANQKNILYFNFDLSVKDIDDIFKKYNESTGVDYKKEKIYVFLDEIQKLGDWQNKVKIYYDLHMNIKFFVSGSSSLFIKKMTRESLAGRSFDFHIGLLKFPEYIQLKGREEFLKNPHLYRDEIKEDLKKYVKTGGFPELLNEEDEFKIKKYVKELVVDRVVYIDIPGVFKIDEPELLQNLISIISSSPGMILDYDTIANDLKRNRKTISNYLFYLEEAFLIKKTYNFSRNRLTSEKKLKRFYPATTALAFLHSADYGKIIESCVLQNSNFKFFYRKNEKEIDFVEAEKEILPIEVKSGKSIDKETKKSMLDFMKKFNVKNGEIITDDYDGEEKIKWFGVKGKIKFIPLWKWLLSK